MKKTIYMLIATMIILSLTMVACAADEPPVDDVMPTEDTMPAVEKTEAPPAEMDPVTITFWHVWGGARLEMIDAMIADFQALYPYITVEHTLLDQGDMVQKYLTSISSGSPPDVIMIHGANHFQSFADEGALTALDDYIAADGLMVDDIFYPADMETYVYEGTTYALPLATGAGSFIFHIDGDAFAAAGLDPVLPTTWAELKDTAEKLTIVDGGTITQMGFSPYGFTNYPFKEWLFLNNGALLSDDGKTVLFNSPEGLEVLTWMSDFYTDLYGGFDKIVDLAAATGSGYNERDSWYNGLVAMHVDGVWHNAQLGANAPDKNVISGLMPYNSDNPDAEVRNIVEGGWGYAMPTGAPNPDAAWLFLQYATAGEGNHSFFKAQGRPTPVIQWNKDPEMAEGNDHWAAYIANIEVSEKSPVTPVSSQINEVITLMTEEVLFGVKTPADALADAAADAQDILDDFWGE